MQTEYALSSTRASALAALELPTIGLGRIARRLRAMARLFSRRRRARRRFDDLRHLDERTLRDLGVTRSELQSVVAELGGQASPSRRRTEFDVWTSSSSRFRVRSIDSGL